MRKPFAVWCVIFGVALVLVPSAAGAQETAIEFIEAAKKDKPEASDEKLRKDLEVATGQKFRQKISGGYETQIEEVVNHKREAPYVTRMTPYAYVVAKLRGANFDILATYQSRAAEAGFTYHSYFVVRSADFPGKSELSLRDIAQYMTKPGSAPRRFVYHNKFSTSSYFVPAAYFRSEYLFNTTERTDKIFPFAAIPTGGSSNDLIGLVAESSADITAVWDEPLKTALANAGLAKKILYVQLPQALPNDFLVCSRSLDGIAREALKQAVQRMPLDNNAEIMGWRLIENVPEARSALEQLERQAIAPPAPVTVDVTTPKSADPRYREYVDAAKEALRVAGTEFAVHNSYWHGGTADVVWKLEIVHDGAVRLTSRFNDAPIDYEQVLPISFTDTDDLVKRIYQFIVTRMHRFRYVWPYESRTPTVLRDVPWGLEKGTSVFVQTIAWLDPERHSFSSHDSFMTKIMAQDKGPDAQRYSQKFELEKWDGFSTDPLSNEAYRVLLPRPSPSRPFFRALTALLVGLFVLAAVAVIVEYVRPSRRTARSVSPPPELEADDDASAEPLAG